MSFGDDGIGIGKTPFARRMSAGLTTRRRRRDVVEAAKPPRLWPISQNIPQNTPGHVNQLNRRDPITTPVHSKQQGRTDIAEQSLSIYGDSVTANNGNG